MIDQTIAHYQITELIGEGGMGQVFRATDTKLKRQVALKLLPESFAQDPQRMARFRREAEVLASLNHPNIAGIYGLEEEGGTHAIAMELVGGETLASPISRGPILPDVATKIALQIAEALEAAHEKGITHRDLKPANVMVTPEGTVKILDFGLAKAMAAEADSGADLTQSPTLTMQATQAGLILGTAAYMSPEQARGQAADKRADIWSFGVVLFEMLTGHSPFQEETVSDSLAAVLRADLNWRLLPPATPRHLRELLRRCLRRDVRQRLRDIGEARIALEETTSGDPATRSLEGAGSGPGSLATTVLPWGLLALVLLFVAITQWGGNGTGAVQEPIAFSIHTNGWNLPVNFVDNPILDVSRDGQQFVWMAGAGNATQLFVRSLDDSEVKAIPGTEGAISPFFSPDGEWIGFFAGGKLKKVASRGANVQDITEVEGLTRGAWWGENETIVFSPNYQSGLWEVQASGGGVPQMLTEVDEAAGERTHRFPQVLPGGDAILLTAVSLMLPVLMMMPTSLSTRGETEK